MNSKRLFAVTKANPDWTEFAARVFAFSDYKTVVSTRPCVFRQAFPGE